MIEKLVNIYGLENYVNIRKISKNSFYNQEDFSKISENFFIKYVESINIFSVLNKTNINISEYKTEELNYCEIYFIYVELKSLNKINELIDIFHSIIPNPMILILGFENKIQISLATKRINKNDSSKQVILELYKTTIFDIDSNKNFVNDLNIKKQSFENFYKFYMDYTDKIFLSNLIEIIGDYKNIEKSQIQILKSLYANYILCNDELEILENQYKDYVSMGDKANIHMKMVDKRNQIDILRNDIKNLFIIN